MGAKNQYGVFLGLLVYFGINMAFAFVVAYFQDAFVGQALHHLPVMNQRAVSINPALSAFGASGCYVDSPLNSDAESSAFCSYHFHRKIQVKNWIWENQIRQLANGNTFLLQSLILISKNIRAAFRRYPCLRVP